MASFGCMYSGRCQSCIVICFSSDPKHSPSALWPSATSLPCLISGLYGRVLAQDFQQGLLLRKHFPPLDLYFYGLPLTSCRHARPAAWLQHIGESVRSTNVQMYLRNMRNDAMKVPVVWGSIYLLPRVPAPATCRLGPWPCRRHRVDMHTTYRLLLQSLLYWLFPLLRPQKDTKF